MQLRASAEGEARHELDRTRASLEAKVRCRALHQHFPEHMGICYPAPALGHHLRKAAGRWVRLGCVFHHALLLCTVPALLPLLQGVFQGLCSILEHKGVGACPCDQVPECVEQQVLRSRGASMACNASVHRAAGAESREGQAGARDNLLGERAAVRDALRRGRRWHHGGRRAHRRAGWGCDPKPCSWLDCTTSHPALPIKLCSHQAVQEPSFDDVS